MAPSNDTRAQAENVFASYLERVQRGAGEPLDELVRRHAHLEQDLRSLHAAWDEVGRLLVDGIPSALSETSAFGAVSGVAADLTSADRVSAEPGREIGGYRLERKLGQGGMGSVWAAEELALGRRVALKLMNPERTSERARAFFEREAKAGARLSHPGIAAVYAFGEEHGVLFLAQELVSGGQTLGDSLQRLRRAERLPNDYYRQVAGLFADVAEALAAAHAMGVLHRDVKPANILLTAGGKPKVVDFGLARLRDDIQLSQSGDVFGTPYYMSPEQARGDVSRLDERSDVFSLGAVLYEALTLVRPFEGDAHGQVLERVRSHEPPRADRVRSRVPSELAIVCAKALDKEPDRRYASMADLAADLRRFLANEPIRARPAGMLVRASKWMRRHPTASAAAGVAAAGLVAVTVAVVHYLDERAKVLRLADAKRLEQLVARAAELWPAEPARVDEYRSWLEEARELSARLQLHERTLAGLRSGVRAGEREEDASAWTFASATEQWHHDALATLASDLREFGNAETGLIADVERRLERAATVVHSTLTCADARLTWSEAVSAIAERVTLYAGLTISPQLGLLPLGPDPDSGLWEFAHVHSGAVPTRDGAGRLVLTEGSGIVLVLLPGGTFRMGTAVEAAELGDELLAREVPPHEVALAPFFMSKYEMTQGQWERCMGENPSDVHPGSEPFGADPQATLLHPVESVSWHHCEQALWRLGLELPTEAQWEYAARAGTETELWTGDDWLVLDEIGNIADASGRGLYRPTMELDDGYARTAPVGRFRANPFGLHDVYGNVWEWCRDEYGAYTNPVAPGDGLRQVSGTDVRTGRGGGWTIPPLYARSGVRDSRPADSINTSYGVRPARRVESARAP